MSKKPKALSAPSILYKKTPNKITNLLTNMPGDVMAIINTHVKDRPEKPSIIELRNGCIKYVSCKNTFHGPIKSNDKYKHMFLTGNSRLYMTLQCNKKTQRCNYYDTDSIIIHGTINTVPIPEFVILKSANASLFKYIKTYLLHLNTLNYLTSEEKEEAHTVDIIFTTDLDKIVNLKIFVYSSTNTLVPSFV